MLLFSLSIKLRDMWTPALIYVVRSEDNNALEPYDTFIITNHGHWIDIPLLYYTRDATVIWGAKGEKIACNNVFAIEDNNGLLNYDRFF